MTTERDLILDGSLRKAARKPVTKTARKPATKAEAKRVLREFHKQHGTADGGAKFARAHPELLALLNGK